MNIIRVFLSLPLGLLCSSCGLCVHADFKCSRSDSKGSSLPDVAFSILLFHLFKQHYECPTKYFFLIFYALHKANVIHFQFMEETKN